MRRRPARPVAGLIVAVAAATAVLGPVLTTTAPAAAAPGPPGAAEYWFDQWNVNQLWQQGARGQNITIAEVDTGVNAALPQLAGRLLPGHDFNTGGAATVDRDDDRLGHGSAMASIMVGAPGPFGVTGLAPAARVMPLAISLNDTQFAGQGGDQVPAAITWAVDHGAKIINLSLGLDRDPHPGELTCEADKQAAIFRALRKGVIVVASSGNDGPTTNTRATPAACLGVVSVGAVDSSGTVAPFSSRHPYLAVTAPGVDIASLGKQPGVAWDGDGTSQAAALTSASLALIWSKFPKLTGAQITSRLMATLDAKRAQADPAYGYGRINPYRAITASVPATATNPVDAAAAPFIRRADGLAGTRALPRPKLPAAAPIPDRHPGRSARPWLDDERVQLGARAGAIGLFVFLVVGGLGLVGGRQRRRARRAVPAGVTAGPPAAIGPPEPPGPLPSPQPTDPPPPSPPPPDPLG